MKLIRNGLFLSVLFHFCFSCLSGAAEAPKEASKETIQEKVAEKVEETTEKVEKNLNRTRDYREKADYFVMANYSPLDLLIPSKYGLSLGLVQDADRSWELEYVKGSLSAPFIIDDLGKMTDERISLIKRSYFESNSFNFSYGLSYYNFSVRLGSEILNRVSGGHGSIDVMNIQALGVNVGIGNRWSLSKNIIAGIDWVSWYQPLLTTKKVAAFLDQATDQNDKDHAEDAVKMITYFPRFVFLKLQIGVLF